MKKKADEAIKHEKQLEKDAEDLKSRLNASNAELDVTLSANRNYSIELSKAKHTNEQLSEQLEAIQKEKRRLVG